MGKIEQWINNRGFQSRTLKDYEPYSYTMVNLYGKCMYFCGRIASVVPRRNASKRSLLLVASVGGLFTLFVTAIYLRRRRKAPTPRDAINESKPDVEESKTSKRKRRPKRNNIDLPVPNGDASEDKKYVSRHKRDHSVMSETSTVSSVKSHTSRHSRKASMVMPGTKEYFEAEQFYQKGVNAFKTALEQWEKAGIVLESSELSSDIGRRLSIRKTNHSESSSVQPSPNSKTLPFERYRSESEGTTRLPTNSIPSSGAGDNGSVMLSEEQVRAPMHEIEEKLLLVMEKAEKLQKTFEGVLYSSGSENDSDTDVTVTGYDVDSDTTSFVSAQEIWETQSLDMDETMNQRLALYEDGLEAVDSGRVRCRTMRTELLECFSDNEFLAKLHCVRQAIDLMLQDATVCNWLVEQGRSMIECLLRSGNRNPAQFIHSYNSLVNYARNSENWITIEEELKYRKVVSMTFYDVVLDFIIMDSFDDLANPPRQLVAVLGNRWLTSSIKETALNTAVWSLLKAKTRMLRYQDGFIAKFYAVSETISPVLAWGFLGTDDKLKCDCEKFKYEVLSFLRGTFSFEQVRYSTREQMSDDILNLARQKIQRVLSHFEISPS